MTSGRDLIQFARELRGDSSWRTGLGATSTSIGFPQARAARWLLIARSAARVADCSVPTLRFPVIDLASLALNRCRSWHHKVKNGRGTRASLRQPLKAGMRQNRTLGQPQTHDVEPERWAVLLALSL